jgi:hypothetical protein
MHSPESDKTLKRFTRLRINEVRDRREKLFAGSASGEHEDNV